MDELNRLVEQAVGSSDSNRRLDALKRLRSITVTPDLLQHTKAAHRIRQLEHADSHEIARTAKELRARWRSAVRQQKDDMSASVKGESEDKNETKPERNAEEQKVSDNAKAEAKSSLVPTGDSKRDKIREKLRDALAMAEDQVPSGDSSGIANAIEDALRDQYGNAGADTNRQYLQKFRSLEFNLKDPKNPDLRACALCDSHCLPLSSSSVANAATLTLPTRVCVCCTRSVMKGDIPPETLVGLSTDELASDEKRQRNERIRYPQRHNWIPLCFSLMH